MIATRRKGYTRREKSTRDDTDDDHRDAAGRGAVSIKNEIFIQEVLEVRYGTLTNIWHQAGSLSLQKMVGVRKTAYHNCSPCYRCQKFGPVQISPLRSIT
jgi:hypothetical protein